MKLKKFAALALAGVMAVSMLAGCNGKSNTTPSNPGADDGETEVVPTSAVVKLFNDNQSASNSAKVEFAADATFESKMQQAVELVGVDKFETGAGEMIKALQNLTGKTYSDTKAVFGVNGIEGVTTTDVFYDKAKEADKAKNGEVNSLLIMARFNGTADMLGPDAIARNSAIALNDVIDDFATTTLVKAGEGTATKPGQDYLNYTYDGTVCVITTTNASGNPGYYVGIVINQNVEKTTLKSPV